MDALQTVFSSKERNSEAMAAFGFRLRNQFSQNKAYRRQKELQWLEDLRMVKGIYDPDVRIEENNSRVYPKIARSKLNIVLSRLHQMLFPEQDKNWEIKPTPEPRVSKEQVTQIAMGMIQQNPDTGEQIMPTIDDLMIAIKKFAKETSLKMSSVIDDQLTEMDYPEETKKVLRSGLTYGTGIMKGPLIGKRTKRKWDPSEKGEYVEKVDQEDVPDLQFTRIWDWYPDMSVTEVEKMTGSFERHIMSKHDLRNLMKRDDFYPEMIKKFLEEHPNGNYTPANWEVDLQTIEIESMTKNKGSAASYTGETLDQSRSTNRQFGTKYEVLEYWGYVDGKDLEACGVNIEDVELEYASCVWLLGDKPIKSALFATALDQYKVFYYEKDETSIFGEGLVRVMRPSVLAIGGGSRMLLDNAAVCLTGDTVVYRNQRACDPEAQRPSGITLRELWDTKIKHNSGLRRMKIRSVDEFTGELFYNRIKDIFNNGIRTVFECKTRHGYSIKATDNHKFLCDTGDWKELNGFVVGDMIAVNGQTDVPTGLCGDCGAELSTKTALRCRKCASKIENSSWNTKQAEDAAYSIEATMSSARQRWACQKDKKDKCERCGSKKTSGVRLEIHHNDRNPYNNDISNKTTLCFQCHKYIHARHDHFGQPFQHRYIDYDEIVSIEYIGEEEVFDLEMEGPNHNFIANGVVSHNCAGPQIEVNWSLVTPDTDYSSVYPRKIWFREGKGIDAQYPALRIYNIDSHTDEILKIIDAFKQTADEETTLPTWMIGQMVNNETAQATSGRMATITISIKDVVKNFDSFTEKIIRDIYAWNMEFNPRPDIKGDFNVKARGVSSLVMKEIRMQALAQLTTTMTPEEWMYIPKREFLEEKLKSHDIIIELLSEEEVSKKTAAQEQSVQNQLALKMAEAEIAYKKAQTMAQLTKAKEHNVKATREAQTPIEQEEEDDPRVTEEEVASMQTDRLSKAEQIRRDEERHQMEMAHATEDHSVKIATDNTRTAHELAMKERMADHKMKMNERMMESSAESDKNSDEG